MESLKKKIQTMNLTKTEKLIADYIVDNMHTIGLSTVTDVALRIGVSDTSVIRFIRSLGFSGFADFKRTMNERMLEQYNANLSPMQKFTNTTEKLKGDSVINEVFYHAMDNLSGTVLELDEDLINKIADCMLASRHKYIVGFRGTSCCADYFYRKALFFLPHLVLCDKAESSAMEMLVDITGEDCVLMFSFPRYSELNFSILDLAKKRGAKVIIVTDRVTSPLAAYADFLVTTNISGVGFTNSYVVPLCFAEALAILVGQKAGGEAAPRMEDLDTYIYKNKLY